jgi:2-phospho-L-lactate guanylyltransferase (CobY/MobA/RfbA family)
MVRGYANPVNEVVKSVNGLPIRNLRHLVEALRDLKDEFVVIAFNRKGGRSIVLPRQEALAATDEILNDNGIRSQGSPNTLAVWTGTPAK